MRLLDRGLAAIEHARLAEVVRERFGPNPRLAAGPAWLVEAAEPVATLAPIGCGAVAIQRRRLVRHAALRHLHLHVRVTLVVGERALRRVDGNLGEVRPAKPRELGVEVREQPALQQRIVAEIDARHHVGRAVGHLLVLREMIVGVAVQHHAAHHLQRHQLFRDQLGRVQVVEGERVRLRLGEQLDCEIPFREGTGVDRLEQVAPVEIVVGALQLGRLIPHQALQAQTRAPMEAHEGGFALRIDQAEAVDAEAFDHPQAARDAAVAHGPEHHVEGFRGERNEIPECVVGAGGLREAAIRLHLHRVDEIRELHRVLDREHGQVVAHQVVVAFLGIELDRKTAHVARGVDRSCAARHGGEPGEHRDPALLGQEFGGRVFGERFGQLEKTMRRTAARMHDALRNPLVVEVGDLFPEHEVFKQCRATRKGAQRVLVVGNRNSLGGGERCVPTR